MKRITDFISSCSMLQPGTKVLCAVSGGADSVCLLHWLSSHSEELEIEVEAAHFEHGIRGEESVRDMEFVMHLCEEWNIPLTVERALVPAYAGEHSLGIEEAARNLRYDFLYRTARKRGCTRIATAHNADDNVETVLFNLARGTGLSGLCGIPPVRDQIVRPLLTTSRREIEEYLSENGLPHVEDSTNENTEYSRNRIRREVVPVLRELNPNLEAAVSRMSGLLRSDEEYLDLLAGEFIKEFYNGESVPSKRLAALPEPVKSRVIRQLCPNPLSLVHVSDIAKLAEGTELAFIDVPGARIRRQRGKIYFTDPPAPKKVQKK